MNVGKYFDQQLRIVGNLMRAEGRSNDYIRGFNRGMRFLSDTIDSIQEQQRKERAERIAEKLKSEDLKVLLGGKKE
ncbi:MAG: hypothetical protein IJK01_08580 [Clostridia bacterium]|nr:hypothetical protein [Clostridia bacterium]